MVVDKIRINRKAWADKVVNFDTSELSCPFWGAVNKCELINIQCKFDLTDVEVPKECPLLEGPVITYVELMRPRKKKR